MKIGILALQGGYAAHAQMLSAMHITPVFVRKAEELNTIAGLIIPGGESSTFLKLLEQSGLMDNLVKAAENGMPFFGTCAGAILMAKQVRSPSQVSLGLVDIVIERNAYGRQLASRVVQGKTTLSDKPMEMVFIRAPLIKEIGKSVEVLASDGEQAVCVQQGKHMVATFHPELTNDMILHQHFINLCS